MRVAPLRLTIATLAAIALTSSGCSGGGAIGSLVPDTVEKAGTLEPALRNQIRQLGPTADRYAQLAGAQLRLGKLRNARSSVQRAIGLDPSHVDAMVVGAQIALAQKDSELALQYYERAVTAHPNARSTVGPQWAKALIDVAGQRAASGSPGGIIMALDTLDSRLPRQAADLRKERATLLAKAARLFLSRRDSERGGQALARAKTADAPADELLYLGAALKLAHDDVAGARIDFETWVKKKPSPQRWSEVAQMARDQRQYGLALDAMKRSKPKSGEELRALAEVALGAKKPSEAADAWRQLAATEQTTKASPFAAAKILLEGARSLEDRAYLAPAYTLYQRAVAIVPGDWSTVQAVGEFLSERYERVGEVPKLVQTHLTATGWTPASVEATVNLLVSAQQVVAASKLVEKAQSKPGADPALWLLRAKLNHLQQDNTSREKAMLTYVANGGQKVGVLTKAGRAWLEFKVLTRATVLAKKAYGIAPADPRAALLLADVHRAARAAGPEKAVLKTFLDKAPDKEAAALEVGRRFFERNDYRTAIRHLTTATRAKAKVVRLDAHKLLFKLYFRGKKSSRAMAAPHLRSWLALVDDKRSRTRILETLLTATANDTTLRAVRQAVLTELLQRKPNDAALLAELGDTQLAEKKFAMARATFDKALTNSKHRAADAQRFGLAFARLAQNSHALHFYEKVAPEELEGSAEGHINMGDRFDGFARRERATRHYELYLRWALKRPVSNKLYRFGEKMLEKRRNKLATRAFEAALQKKPKHLQSQRGLAKALLRQGDLEPARLVLDRYISSSGRAADKAMRDAASEFRQAGALDDAARIMEELFVKTRSGRRVSLFHSINALYRRMGALDKIRRLGRRFLDLNQHNPRTVLLVANALGAAGLWDEGYAMLTDAMDPPRLGASGTKGRKATKYRRKPRAKDLRTLLQAAGDMALKRNDLTAALEHFQAYALASRSRPNDWANMARRIAGAGHPAEAAKFLTYPMDKDLMDGDPKFFLQRGTYRMEAGLTEEAHRDFLEAIGRTLSVSEMLPKIEVIYRKYGQLRRLRRVLARAIQMSPTRSQQFLSLGKLLLEGGRVAEAAQSFKRYLATKERGHLNVARAYAEAGFPKRALSHFERAYEHADKPVAALTSAAELLTQQGLTERIGHHVQRYLLVSKSPEAAFRQVAKIWEETAHDPKQALSWFRRASETAPAANDHFHLGRLAWLSGDTASAEAEFRLHLNTTLQTGASSSRAVAGAAAQIILLYAARSDFKGATRMLNHATALLGDDPRLVAARAELLVLQGQVGPALELIAQHPLVMSEANNSIANLAIALSDQGRREEALSLVDDALAIGHNHRLASLQLGLRAQLGLVEDAARSGQALAVSGTPDRHLSAAMALFNEGIMGPSTKHLEVVLRDGLNNYDATRNSRPGTLRTIANAVILLMRAQQFTGKKAMTNAQKLAFVKDAVRTGDDLVTQDQIIGIAFYGMGEFAIAQQAADRALRRAPADRTMRQIMLMTAVMLNDSTGLLKRIEETPGMRTQGFLSEALEKAVAMNHPRFALAMIAALLQKQGGNLQLLRQAIELALQAGDDTALEAYAVKYAQAQENSKRAFVRLSAMAAKHGYTEHAKRWAKQGEGATGIDAHALRLVHLGLALKGTNSSAIKTATKEVLAKAPDKRIARLQVVELVDALAGPGDVALEVLGDLVNKKNAQTQTLVLAAQAAWKSGDSARARKIFDRFSRRPALPQHKGLNALQRLVTVTLRAGDIDGLKKVLAVFAQSLGKRHQHSGQVLSGTRQVLLDLAYIATKEPDLTDSTRRAAAEILKQGLMRTSGRGWSPVNRSVAEMAIKQLTDSRERAVDVYENHLADDPNSTIIANNLAYEMAGSKVDLPRALKLVNQALLMDMDVRGGLLNLRPSYLDTKAWIFYRMGRFKEALRLQQQATRAAGVGKPGKPTGALAGIRSMMPMFDVTRGNELEMLYHLAMIERANGLTMQAQQTLRDCARRLPGHLYAARCLSELATTAR